MKIKEIYFGNDTYATLLGQHVRHLKANDRLEMELDLSTLSVRVNDRNTNGDGVYHVPLACLRRWVPIEAPQQSQKKAANQ
jgi:hypothetical protein